MPRWFVGNFHFEHFLVSARSPISARQKRLDAELASAWLSIAEDGDVICTPVNIPAEFWESMAAQGFPRVRVVADWRACPAEAELVPWGWTREYSLVRTHQHPPAPEVVRRLNSRRWSATLELEWGTALPGSAICRSLDELAEAISRLPRTDAPWVLKAEFGMSGRERCLGRGSLSQSAIAWACRRLHRDGVVFLEPWVTPLEEVGILWEIPRRGPPQLVDLVPMHIEHGQYRGSWFCGVPALHEDRTELTLMTFTSADHCRHQANNRRWNEAIVITAQVAELAQREGYHGPLGIDAMRFRAPSGAVQVRALQDINARWTMGRLALGWRRWYASCSRGLWWHGPARTLSQDLAAPFQPCRVIPTSPSLIDDQSASLASALLIWP